MHNALDIRMKEIENLWRGPEVSGEKPTYARIDGRSFSNLTKGLERPFSTDFTLLMRHTALTLAQKTHPLAAYVQSDEISLVWHWRTANTPDGQALFGGRQQKLASVLAGLATSIFVSRMSDPSSGLSHLLDKTPHFDARIIEMPSEMETVETLAWRGADARKNSVSQIARAHFTHGQLQGKRSKEMRHMLDKLGYSWESYPQENRFGTLYLPRKRGYALSHEQLTKIPESRLPQEPVTRKIYEAFTATSPDLIKNLRNVVFRGEEPIFS